MSFKESSGKGAHFLEGEMKKSLGGNGIANIDVVTKLGKNRFVWTCQSFKISFLARSL